MAEYSYFWPNNGIGDASISPYSNDEFSDVWSAIAQFDRRSSFVVYADLFSEFYGGAPAYIGSFQITIQHFVSIMPGLPPGTSGTANDGGSVTLADGVAIVDGKIYRQLGDETFRMQQQGYYRIVLEKDFSAQLVGFNCLFNANEMPQCTQDDGVLWQVSILTTQVDGTGDFIEDVKVMSRDSIYETGESRWTNGMVVCGGRSGNSDTDWSVGGVLHYAVGPCRIEIGTATIAASPTQVDFAEAFPYKPVVVLMPYDPGSDWAGATLWISEIDVDHFDVSAGSVVNFDEIFYIAFGDVV